MTLFGTAGIRGDVRETVTPELAMAVGRAAAIEAATGDTPPTFVVARDGRETGQALVAAMTAGLTSGGANVLQADELPTPALAFATRDRRGVMMTASHNPPHDNGVKLFQDGVEYDTAAEDRIEAQVKDSPSPTPWDRWGSVRSIEPLDRYREAVCTYAQEFGTPLDELSIVVDCGNGMASVATPAVLRQLGADVIALNANVDGHFPGRASKPTPESLTDLRAFVADRAVDLGIAHDGDADRIVVVDATGDVVHEDTVLAILAEAYVRASQAADPVVVTTPNASGRIDERVEAANGRTTRVRLGALHEGIADVETDADSGTQVVFAAEPWKHIHPAFGGWIDGVASAAVFSRLVADAGDIAALRAPVAERPYRKLSIDCPDTQKEPAMSIIAERLPEAFPDGDIDTEYGVRIDRPDGSWVLVRPSGTEPYIRIYVESDSIDEMVEAARAVVEGAVDAAQGMPMG
ncbi:MAG: phosphopentomutase/phosphoglucosamine mutase [Halobacteriales archaeon]